MRKLIGLHLLLLLMAPIAAEADTDARDQAEEERAAKLHTEFDFESFRDHPPASQRIDFDEIDYDLLSAATFHETNRTRADHGLSELGYAPELVEAARIQADGMARMEAISHQHPEAASRTLEDRLKRVGLQPAFAAENVAMTFGIEYESGEPVVPREENRERVFSYEPGGEVIPPHTYLSYAETLLEQWMNSPGHRENILQTEPEQLGTGHRHATNEMGMDVFYSVQVFFTDLEARRGSR